MGVRGSSVQGQPCDVEAGGLESDIDFAADASWGSSVDCSLEEAIRQVEGLTVHCFALNV